MLAFLWSCSSLALSWPDKYDWQIRKAVKNYLPTVDWRLYKAQLIQESSLRPLVVSHAGAKGLAQFMPSTWADVSSQLQLVGSPFEPHSCRCVLYVATSSAVALAASRTR